MTEVLTHPIGFGEKASQTNKASAPASDRYARKKSARSSIEFRFILVLTFAFFLAAAAVERLMPWRWLGGDAKQHSSIFKEAWETASTCTSYAFMG
jgi:hypothetical protein